MKDEFRRARGGREGGAMKRALIVAGCSFVAGSMIATGNFVPLWCVLIGIFFVVLAMAWGQK